MKRVALDPHVWQCADERFNGLPRIAEWIFVLKETFEEDDWLAMDYGPEAYFLCSPIGLAQECRLDALRVARAEAGAGRTARR